MAANALLLVVLSYVGTNLPYALGSEGALMKRLEVARQVVKSPEEDSRLAGYFLPVNVGYDREMVPVTDEFGIYTGELPIVSREKIWRLLEMLDTGAYRCVVVDVNFLRQDSSAYDKRLFEAINSMPRLIVAGNGGEEQAPGIREDRLAPAQYSVTIDENNFVKYRFNHAGQRDIALRIYNMTRGRDSDLRGFLPQEDGRLAFSAIYLPLPYRIEGAYDENFEKNFYNLGEDILKVYDRESLSALTRDKIIMIGDYTGGDDHDTYAGTMSGPAIISNAVIALSEGKHIVKWGNMGIMFGVYLLIMCAIVAGPEKVLPERIRQMKLWRFATMFMGYTTMVIIMNIGFYIFSGEIYDLFLPLAYLSLLWFVRDNNLIPESWRKQFESKILRK